MLTREAIRDGAVRRMIAAARPAIPVFNEEELRESRRAVLAEAPNGRDIWVFGYGSLIWNPAFHFAERRIGHVHGYHRRFCLWTHLGRGSPERPGLTLGLEPGGCCRGVAYRIAAPDVESETEIVWLREMVSGAYVPRWVEAHTEVEPGKFASVRAITFVINRKHVRYAGALPDDVIAEAIATASGPLGPCADYLFNTVEHLEDMKIRDRGLARLRDLVMIARGKDRVGAP